MATQKKKASKVQNKATKSVVKRIAPAAKKAANTKSAKKPATKKSAVKKIVPKKPASKSVATIKKTAKPISKPSLVKKPAKPVVKKAAPKKLSDKTKKTTTSKVESKTQKAKVAPIKTAITAKNQPVKAQKVEHKAAEKVAIKAPVVNINDHKKELKKALKKAKDSGETRKPFVMPKTNTEKARKYEPQFIKSVLDQAPEENNGPSMRYSDNELNEFKDLISRKLETAKKELGYLQGLITRKDEMGGDDTDNRYMTMEDGSLSMEREQLSQMASRQITFIDHLEKAMMRIENKTYGICRVTGKLIDKARLRAVPHATLSIEAKMGIAR